MNCVHCGRPKERARRGMICFHCRMTRVSNTKGIGILEAYRHPSAACKAGPGTLARIEYYARRAERGEILWCNRDARELASGDVPNSPVRNPSR